MLTKDSSRMLKRYRGIVVPMVTPFTPEGDLDEPAVRRIIDHLIEGGVEGIFVLGTTGEEASMPMSMRSRLVAITVGQVQGRATTYAGISHNCLAYSVQAAEEYIKLGIDVLVARLPSYYALSVEEQRDYYLALIERIPGPLILYNISSTTHMAIPIEVVERLSESPKVVGIKDSDNDLSRLKELLKRLGGRPDFSILVGVTELSVQALSMGADGCVPSPGNLVPGVCQQLYESAIRGDMETAEIYQRKLNEIVDIFRTNRTLAESLGLLKAAMGALSLCGPYVLPPLRTPDAAQQEAVRQAFHKWVAERG